MEFVVPHGFGEILENRVRANKSYFLLSQFCKNEEIENCKTMDSQYILNTRFLFNKLMNGPRHYKFAVEFIKGYIPKIRPENISLNYIIDPSGDFIKEQNTKVIAAICLQHCAFGLYIDNNTTQQKIISLIPGDLFLFDSTLHISGKISAITLLLVNPPIEHEEPQPISKWSSLIAPFHGWIF